MRFGVDIKELDEAIAILEEFQASEYRKSKRCAELDLHYQNNSGLSFGSQLDVLSRMLIRYMTREQLGLSVQDIISAVKDELPIEGSVVAHFFSFKTKSINIEVMYSNYALACQKEIFDGLFTEFKNPSFNVSSLSLEIPMHILGAHNWFKSKHVAFMDEMKDQFNFEDSNRINREGPLSFFMNAVSEAKDINGCDGDEYVLSVMDTPIGFNQLKIFQPAIVLCMKVLNMSGSLNLHAITKAMRNGDFTMPLAMIFHPMSYAFVLAFLQVVYYDNVDLTTASTVTFFTTPLFEKRFKECKVTAKAEFSRFGRLTEERTDGKFIKVLLAMGVHYTIYPCIGFVEPEINQESTPSRVAEIELEEFSKYFVLFNL